MKRHRDQLQYENRTFICFLTLIGRVLSLLLTCLAGALPLPTLMNQLLPKQVENDLLF